jgi:ribose-phosphate pyrophosphokinase
VKLVSQIKIFTGNANPLLAQDVASYLTIPLGKANVGRFSDGEILVEILESVRGQDVFIIQSISAPTNDNLMELMIMVDAFYRSSAQSITAVIPYFGYARQDRRVRSARVPITAKVVADMLMNVGVERMITIDLHADQIQGFFEIPVDNIYATAVMLEDIRRHPIEKPLIVSPDVGGVVRARAFAKRLNDTELAIIDKRRPGPNQAEVMNIIGDVKGRHCIIVDDIVDTAGTLYQATLALKQHGAKTVKAYCTHPVLSGPALNRINSSELDEVVVSDSIPLREEAKACPKIRQFSIAKLIADTIDRINHKESVSSMFD